MFIKKVYFSLSNLELRRGHIASIMRNGFTKCMGGKKMKNSKYLFLCLLVFLLLGWLGITKVEAKSKWPSKSGAVCWNVVWSNKPDHVVKFFIVKVGTGYYTVQSKMENISQHLEIFFGSAQIVGNQIIMSTHATHSDSQPIPSEDADQSSCQLFLDSATLNGTGWCTGTFYNPPDGGSGIDYSTGTLTYTQCP
jgi:hypothetical protein